MWDLLIGVVIVGPLVVLLGREVVAEVVFTVWMRRSDRPAPRYWPVAEPVARSEVTGWSGAVVDGDVVEVER